jgi:hypothetical protein
VKARDGALDSIAAWARRWEHSLFSQFCSHRCGKLPAINASVATSSDEPAGRSFHFCNGHHGHSGLHRAAGASLARALISSRTCFLLSGVGELLQQLDQLADVNRL